jgi:hypothetical protein
MSTEQVEGAHPQATHAPVSHDPPAPVRSPTVPTTLLPSLASALEAAQSRGVSAAVAGLQDAALGALRLTGPGVPVLAEAAVSSATPFLRAPLLARLSAVLLMHPPTVADGGTCPSCGKPAPCPTSRLVQW